METPEMCLHFRFTCVICFMTFVYNLTGCTYLGVVDATVPLGFRGLMGKCEHESYNSHSHQNICLHYMFLQTTDMIKLLDFG